MTRDNPWAGVVNAAGAAGAAIASVYAIGAVVMSLRYEGFGISGQEAVAVTPREVLLFAGSRSLAIWTAVGLIITIGLRRLQGELAGTLVAWLRRPPGIVALSALVVALVALPHVVWPLAVVFALGLLLAGATSWHARPVLRAVAAAAAVAAVALGVEADRLRYQLVVSCVDVDATRTPRCGILVGQNELGTYVATPPATGARSGRYAMIFVPAARVRTASSHKEPRMVIEEFARARRRPLLDRLLGIRIQ